MGMALGVHLLLPALRGPARRLYTASSLHQLCVAQAALLGTSVGECPRPHVLSTPQLCAPSVVLRHVLWSHEPDPGALTTESRMCPVRVPSVGKPVSPLSRRVCVEC